MRLRVVYQTWQDAVREIATYFNDSQRKNNPRISADNGDSAVTLYAGQSEPTQIWSTALTADRAVTLSTTAWEGAKFRIVRTGGGAFNLNVGTGPLKALVANTWCDVEFNGTAWILTAYGAL